jgi:hypothetical protein
VGSFFLVPLWARVRAAVDDGRFSVGIETPAGSSLDYTAAKLRQVDAVLKAAGGGADLCDGEFGHSAGRDRARSR